MTDNLSKTDSLKRMLQVTYSLIQIIENSFVELDSDECNERLNKIKEELFMLKVQLQTDFMNYMVKLLEEFGKNKNE